jgi:hypothetical protein
MRLFGRSRRAVAGEPRPEHAPGAGEENLAREQADCAPLPPEGSYVTDGASLYRVAHAMRDPRDGELIIELEDCRTLELILCSASVVADLRLCTVTPTGG